MPSIPPKKPSVVQHVQGKEAHGLPLLQRLEHALQAKDEGELNVLLFRVASQASKHPADLQQVFRHLHEVLQAAARQGTALNHKEEVASFLGKHGHQRLQALSKEILHPKDANNLQKNIGEARWLLAAGYGGKDAAKYTNAVNMRSFGQAPKTSQSEQAAKTSGAKKGALHAIKDAFTASAPEDGRQGVRKKLSAALQRATNLVTKRNNKK